eukprot:Skav218784  [mRNA]  locus=scaffold3133:6632:9276:- [translate_table: standard]
MARGGRGFAQRAAALPAGGGVRAAAGARGTYGVEARGHDSPGEGPGRDEVQRCGSDEASAGRRRIEVRHRVGLYHEAEPVDLICAFQPGLWGYSSWQPSIHKALDAAPLCLDTHGVASSGWCGGSGWGGATLVG